jgi:hypothetical protein
MGVHETLKIAKPEPFLATFQILQAQLRILKVMLFPRSLRFIPTNQALSRSFQLALPWTYVGLLHPLRLLWGLNLAPRKPKPTLKEPDAVLGELKLA